MRFANLIGNKFFSLAFSWLLGQPIKDTLCGTKVLRRDAYQALAANRAYFGDFDPFGDFDLLFGAAKLGTRDRRAADPLSRAHLRHDQHPAVAPRLAAAEDVRLRGRANQVRVDTQHDIPRLRPGRWPGADPRAAASALAAAGAGVADAISRLYLLGKRLTERRELATLQSLIEPGMVIADIGANVGFYALQMATVGRLRRARSRVRTRSVHLRAARRRTSAPLGEHRGAAIRPRGGTRNGHALLQRLQPRRQSRRAASRRAERRGDRDSRYGRSTSYLTERGLAAVDAMKIDVQGLEAQVLRGAEQTIRGVHWIWVEFSPDHLRGAGTDPEGFLESLGALGMQVFEVTEQRHARAADRLPRACEEDRLELRRSCADERRRAPVARTPPAART